MRYAAFLRAVNVGTHNRCRMADLVQGLPELGLENVHSYIQSGNLIFDSEPRARLAAQIEEWIQAQMSVTTRVALRDLEQMRDLLERSPFHSEPTGMVVFFIEEPPIALPPGFSKTGEVELISTTQTEAFMRLHPKQPRPVNVGAFSESELKVPTTTRKWAVVAEIARRMMA